MILPKPMIKRKIAHIGNSLSQFYAMNMIVIGQSSFKFASELYSTMPNNVESVSILEPYLENDGSIFFSGGFCADLNNKVNLLVHSACDTGYMYSETHKKITSEFPDAIIKNVCMVNKTFGRALDFHTDYSVIDIESDIFVVGYGIGIENEYRELESLFELFY